MENQNPNQIPNEENWFDDILGKQETPPELGLDESAVFSAGLIHPADMELEQIIQETKAMEQPTAPPAPDPHFHAPDLLSEEPFRDEEFRQAFGEGQELEAVFAESGNTAEPEAAVVPEPVYAVEPEPVYEVVPEPVYDPQPEPILEEAVAAEELPAPESVPEAEKPVKKRRPRMKKGSGLFGIPHILSTLVWGFIVLAIGVTLGRLVWVCCVDVLAFGKDTKEAVITIYEGDTIEDIADKLEKAGIIEYPELFTLYMNFSGSEELEVGVHQLTPMIYDYHAIKTALEPKAAAREVVEVVIPEGYTCQQIFALLEEEGICSVAELEAYAANGDLNDYWFLEGVERGDKYCLEGYLFPDTYQFYKNHDPELVLEKMLDNFDYRFTDIMKDKIDTLNERLAATLRSRGYSEAYIEEHKFTIREVVIVASMIERETANGSESYDISSVIYNRLTNPGNYPYLNIDATVIYGMGGARIDPTTGETLPLTVTDLQTDTPYNTYTRKGLPAGPISNPGRNSLNAALDPNDTSYYYYVYYPSAGGHLFAKTEAEHEQNKARVND